MDLRPTQGGEKRLLSSHRSSWERRPLLCHPERTRISCHAAPENPRCPRSWTPRVALNRDSRIPVLIGQTRSLAEAPECEGN
jgi:hypothetical protein